MNKAVLIKIINLLFSGKLIQLELIKLLSDCTHKWFEITKYLHCNSDVTFTDISLLK